MEGPRLSGWGLNPPSQRPQQDRLSPTALTQTASVTVHHPGLLQPPVGLQLTACEASAYPKPDPEEYGAVGM